MKIYKYLHYVFLLFVVIFSLNFSNGFNTNTSEEPQFVPLMQNNKKLLATIFDEKNKIRLKEVSFTGTTKIGGIRRTSDDSINVLDLSKLKEIIILNPNYISKKYQDKEFILSKVVFLSGKTIDDLLIPRNVVVCGINTDTDMETAWYLRKIQRMVIEHNKSHEIKRKEVNKAEKSRSLFDKIKKTFSSN